MNISFRYCGAYYSVLASGTVDIEACNDVRLEVRGASDDFKLWGDGSKPHAPGSGQDRAVEDTAAARLEVLSADRKVQVLGDYDV